MQRHRSPALGLLLMTAYCHVLAAETVNLPAPTGTFAVGRRLIHWIDTSRAETMSSRPNDRREVTVWIWYPSVAVPGAKPAPYVDQLDQLSNAMSSDELALARSVQTNAVSNGAIASTRSQLPVILFSPGSGSIPALYTTLFEELASHGYVVAAVDHPYDGLAVSLADGRVVKQSQRPTGEEILRFEHERVKVRTQDLRFVLDQLGRIADGRIADPLQGRLNLSHVGAFGHSVGGLTAAEVCRVDARVLACSNMDGVVNAMPAYDGDSAPRLVRPFLFLEKPLPAMKGEAPEDARPRLTFLRGKGNALLAKVKSGTSYRVTITGATHATFSDEEFVTNQSGKRQGELLDLVRVYLRSFFDRTLKSQTSTALDIAPLDAAVQIQTFSPM